MEEKKKGGTNWIANPKLSTVIEEKKKTETPNAMQRAWIQKKKNRQQLQRHRRFQCSHGNLKKSALYNLEEKTAKIQEERRREKKKGRDN